jgi:hypothetical protein
MVCASLLFVTNSACQELHGQSEDLLLPSLAGGPEVHKAPLAECATALALLLLLLLLRLLLLSNSVRKMSQWS